MVMTSQKKTASISKNWLREEFSCGRTMFSSLASYADSAQLCRSACCLFKPFHFLSRLITKGSTLTVFHEGTTTFRMLWLRVQQAIQT